jgi:(R,R)-butanediol dehydrogenase/meso-butanediol dehydrogenase/diacetyl reductase
VKAAVFEAPGRPLTVADVPDPEPGPDDLIIEVTACGICGSDLHASDVRDASGGRRALPAGTVMGHEFAGRVVAAGSAARAGWEIGARVTALPYLACGACEACAQGNRARCRRGAPLGLGQLPGAYAEFVRVGARETLRLPESVDDCAGATVEPLSVGLHAVNVARPARGESALVMGAGPIGLAVALWCRFFGLRHIVVTDLAPARLERAAAFGATGCIDARADDAIERVKALVGERPRLVFDCVGVPGSQQTAMDYAPFDGRVVVVGVCMQPDRILPVKAITKELQVNYVYGYRREDFAFAIDMLAAGRIDSRPMVTGSVGFEAFSAAFEALKTDKGHCKVMLEPARAYANFA